MLSSVQADKLDRKVCRAMKEVSLGTQIRAAQTRINNGMRFDIPLPGTLGVDVNPDGAGCLFGSLTLKDPGDATYGGIVAQYDVDGSPQITDYTTEAAEATGNDVLPFPTAPALNDYGVFGSLQKFFGLLINITTQSNMSATTIWEYSKAAYGTLTPKHDASTILQVAGTGFKLVTFEPPADWAADVLPDTITGTRYHVRCRISAFTSSTTEPLIGQVKFLHAVGSGYKIPVAGQVDALVFNFNTVSGSTADSVFLLVNLTQGTWQSYTKTKATAYQRVAGVLAVAADDELALVQIGEDGSTEFADGSVHIEYTPTAL